MSSHSLTQTQKDALEAMIDSADLDAVLGALEEICLAKAEHIRTNWQDAHTARPWEHNAKVIAAALKRTV